MRQRRRRREGGGGATGGEEKIYITLRLVADIIDSFLVLQHFLVTLALSDGEWLVKLQQEISSQ